MMTTWESTSLCLKRAASPQRTVTKKHRTVAAKKHKPATKKRKKYKQFRIILVPLVLFIRILCLFVAKLKAGR
jgi:hypothetical protein